MNPLEGERSFLVILHRDVALAHVEPGLGSPRVVLVGQGKRLECQPGIVEAFQLHLREAEVEPGLNAVR